MNTAEARQPERLPVDPTSVIGPKFGYFFAKGRDKMDGQVLVYDDSAVRGSTLQEDWATARSWSTTLHGQKVVGVDIRYEAGRLLGRPVFNHLNRGYWTDLKYKGLEGFKEINLGMWEENING